MQTTVTALAGNRQRLDGGAMYGNAPRALWARWSPPDERNRIQLSCRCFLIEHGDAGSLPSAARPGDPRPAGTPIRTLLETGIGCFFPPRLRERFGVDEDEHVLLRSLAERGLSEEDIDQVILSHLHFDHAGGLLPPHGEPQRLLFPQARYFVSAAHWARANQPHARDRASFLPDLNAMLAASGRLVLVEGDRCPELVGPFSFHRSSGHTIDLMITEVSGAQRSLLFLADLVPGAPWVHLPITMGYDRFPEQLIDEKRSLWQRWLNQTGRNESIFLAFTHDPSVALAHLGMDERGRYRAELPLSEADAVQVVL